MEFKDTFFSDKPETALVMGILNVTPDSFYPGSRAVSVKEILKRAAGMISQGADIIDIGAVSTRPGAKDIPQEEELSRLRTAIGIIKAELPGTRISVDTYRSQVAEEVIEKYGADLINDISGGDLDRGMFPLIARTGVPYILMHMRGTPQTMAKLAEYGDVVAELKEYFRQKLINLQELGVRDIILDPGFGFAKTPEHNFQILNRLESFKEFDLPLLVGLSRKSMIYRTLGTDPEAAGNGTTVLQTIALMKGARILRTHDVREAREAVILYGKTLASPGMTEN